MNKPLPTQSEVKLLLDFDSTTGVFTHKNRPWLLGREATWNIRYAGKRAGRLVKIDNRWKICINDIGYLAHRVAWLYVYGVDPADQEIDHKNGDATDNRIENLRLADRSEQNCNREDMKIRRGVKVQRPCRGVRENKIGKFEASIAKNGKSYFLGTHLTLESAKEAYRIAREKFHGEFIRDHR